MLTTIDQACLIFFAFRSNDSFVQDMFAEQTSKGQKNSVLCSCRHANAARQSAKRGCSQQYNWPRLNYLASANLAGHV